MEAIFSPTNQFAQATGAIIDTNTAFYTNSVNALFDAGMDAAQHQADAMRTYLASATVAMRQWLGAGAGAFDWADPVARYLSHGRSPQSPPIGMALAYIFSPQLAVDSGAATR